MSRLVSIIILACTSSLHAQDRPSPVYKKAHGYSSLWDSISTLYNDEVSLAIPYTEKLLLKARLNNDSTQIIQATKYQGLIHRKMGNYVQSIDKFKSVYQYAKSGNNQWLTAEAADQIGIMNTFMGNMSEAQPYIIEVSEIYDSIGSKEDKANANNGLAIFYNDIGQEDKAIEKFNVSLRQYEDLDDTMGRANVHANLGLLYLDRNEYDLAEKNILMQGYLDTLMNTQWGLGFHHDFMGSLKRKQGKLNEALQWKKSSLEIRKNLPSHYNKAESLSGLSSVYLALGNYKECIKNAELILQYKDDHRSLSQQMSSYSLLSSAYEKLGQYERSLTYHKLYKSMSDSIYNRDMLSEMETKDALYEKAKQDKEILALNTSKTIADNKIANKNRIILLGGIAIGIVSILLLFLYKLLTKYRDQKKWLTKALKEKDILLREIHHRVKNNLQLISSLLTLQGRSIDDEMAIKAITEGKNRVRSMALIHQDLYQKDSLTTINVPNYINKLTRELFDTYKINEGNVELHLDIDNIDMDVDNVIPIGLIVNELVTNSLKYAFSENDKGTLRVSIKKTGNEIILCVQDDGRGYNISEIRENSFGSTLISALSDQLEATLNIDSNNGTKVELIIPS